jgi:hypothetical protein
VITSARCFRQFIGLGYLSIPHDPITSGYGYVSGARRRTTSSSLALLRLWLVPSSRLFHLVNKWMVADWKGAVAVTLTCLWSRRARSGGWSGLSEPHLTFLWRPPSIWAQTAVSVWDGFRPPSLRSFSSIALFFLYLAAIRTGYRYALTRTGTVIPFFFSVFFVSIFLFPSLRRPFCD